MNKITREKNKEYTTISNVFLRDENLSLKAKGFLAIVMSLPDNWDFSIAGVTKIVKEGKTAIYSTIDELKEYGYCKVITIRNKKGVIVGNDYSFFEQPYLENPHPDYPYPENPNMDNPNMENQPQINTNINKVCIEQNKEDKEKELKEKSKSLFEECWVTYRRKGSKKKSKDYWDKLTDKEKDKVMPHIKAYVGSREMVYQKDFERYLRDKTFNDVVLKGSATIYDPTIGETNEYHPFTDGEIQWNDYYKSYIYVGMDLRWIPDGYTDDNRPDGATIMLNNGRGTIVWDKSTKSWNKK